MNKMLRYTATGLGLAVTGVVAAIAIGEGMPNVLKQPQRVQIEFAALGIALAGTLVALKWGRLGGALMIAGALLFEGVEIVTNHNITPFMLLFLAVGLLQIMASYLSGSRSAGA